MAAGDVTRTVAKQLLLLRPEGIQILRNPNRMVVLFVDDDGVTREVIAANGACRGWNDDAGTVISTTVAAGFSNAMTALRSGANINAGITALVAQLRTDGLLVVTGTVA